MNMILYEKFGGFVGSTDERGAPSYVTQAQDGGEGHHWVERILSLRETCRLQATSTYTVL
jgi:hypothetical protein